MTKSPVRVPNIGDFKDVGVVEVFVKPGDAVKVDDSLVTLESDKATMDVPSPASGTVVDIQVKAGDRVSEGSVLLTLAEEAPASAGSPPEAARPAAAPLAPPARPAPTEGTLAPSPPIPGEAAERPPGGGRAHASPLVRTLARELGVDLSRVSGSGRKGRILREDVQRFVKQALATEGAERSSATGLDLLPWPRVDFARFGPVESRPLARIRRISAANLARNWVMIPHVTQFGEADITELEALRLRLNGEAAPGGPKVTLLAFVVKACAAALQRFPDFNASLDGDSLVWKRYYNVGFAADTPHGLVVPVLKDADKKGILDIARELGELAARAREGKLAPADMQGGTFSVSSLGGIAGTAFTPIINAPEVAILGVSRTATKPVWDGHAFAPRLVLPLSLSYDHRVIDGAAAARFVGHVAELLGDLRRALL
ncbi:MAG TPA: dihydrolipoyllysine-residue acetyltransferase [Anaeromyxobacteraceae bacterium]|nr:dihydrolipoyllysine-residue acetyltransferase [Anaeromyxobacteraceae bacterium]